MKFAIFSLEGEEALSLFLHVEDLHLHKAYQSEGQLQLLELNQLWKGR
jgi:hypothetical protein